MIGLCVARATNIQTVNVDELTGAGGERKIWGALNEHLPHVPKSARTDVRTMVERLVGEFLAAMASLVQSSLLGH